MPIWVASYGSLKGGIGQNIEGDFPDCLFLCFSGLSVFSLYGPWEAGNACKIYLAGLGAFLDIENVILRTLCFDFFGRFPTLPT